MIKNTKFDEARTAALALSLVKPRSEELSRYKCLDCAFYTKEHYQGEDEVDCFNSDVAADSPFTCLFHSKTLYNALEEACVEIRLKPMDAKFKELDKRLSQNEIC